ncbi:MAG TPA: aspartate aminotransferase family protein [Casimicrobiaceae bacterium]|nr:aspartate aminotransferase family protein [Casimicrobiaceae bacterium]
MTRVMHRNLRVTPPVAVGGAGIEIVDRSGKRYIDASGGAAVSCLGHAHPDVLAAMHAQIDRIAYAHTSFFTTDAVEALADALAENAPPGLANVYLISGGSEAMEAALKLARQYAVEIGESQRSVFIARRQSYHGNTLGALAVGGNEWRRREFEPLLMHVERVSPCFEYRERRDTESQQAFTDRLIAELETTIDRVGPYRVLGFCAETVVGATAGAVPPTPDYFRRVREVLDRCGALWIADEVMCGVARTGTMYAFEQEGVVPDIVTIAKGLGGGYQPIGAVVASDRVVAPIRDGSGAFQHGHTYIGHATAAAAALAVQRVIKRDHLLDAVRERGRHLGQALHRRFGDHPHVGDIRGRGLFHAIEFVSDRARETPFAPALRLHARVKAAAMREGLCVYPMGGTIDGVCGDHVLIAPPYIIRDCEIDEVVMRLSRAVDSALDETRREGDATSLAAALPSTEES